MSRRRKLHEASTKGNASSLKQNQVAIRMDGRGRALDNVFIERLWIESLVLQAVEPTRARAARRFAESLNLGRLCALISVRKIRISQTRRTGQSVKG